MQVVAERTSALKINKLGEHIGAEVTGVDMTKPVDEETRQRLLGAIAEHVALVVRDQNFTSPEQFLEAARVFGAPAVRPAKTGLLPGQPYVHMVTSREADKTGVPKRTGEHWHTDHTNMEEPTNFTFLYPIELPVNGAKTLICNMHASWRTLPDGLKKRVEGMQTANVIMGSASRAGRRGKADSREAQRALNPTPVVHPLVRTHPANGRKALYFNQSKLENIVGMTPDESQDFLDTLVEISVKPELVYAHEHRLGDMLVWDNRSSMHMAGMDYEIVGDRHRSLYRIIAGPEKPV